MGEGESAPRDDGLGGRPTDFLTAVEARWRAGDLRGAESLLREALARDPRDPRPMAMLAGVLADEDRFDPAQRLVERAIDAAGGGGGAHAGPRFGGGETRSMLERLRADILRRAGRRNEAVDALRSLLEADPAGPQAGASWHNLAGLLAELGRYDEADRALGEGLIHLPADAELHAARGLVAVACGRYQDSIRHYETAVGLAAPLPADARERIRAGLAEAFDLAGDTERAIAVYRELMAERPDTPLGPVSLGVTLWRARRWAEAAEVLATAARRFPEEHDALYYLASSLRNCGRRDDAERVYRDACARWPECPTCLLGLAEVLHETGRAAEAALALRHVLASTPDDADAVALFADARWELGERDEARRLFVRAMSLAPNELRHVYNFALREQEAGRLEEACGLFDRALKIEPENYRALYFAAVLRAELGRAEEAIPFLRSFLAGERGPRFAAIVRADASLDAIKTLPSYRELVGAGTSLLDFAALDERSRARLGGLLSDIEPGGALPESLAGAFAGGAEVRGPLAQVLPQVVARLERAGRIHTAPEPSGRPPRYFFEARADDSGRVVVIRHVDAGAAGSPPRGMRAVAAIRRTGPDAFLSNLAPEERASTA